MPFRSLLANTTTKGKVVMAASALAVLAVMLVMFKVASAPSYTTMLTGLDPAETGKITAALDSSGVSYQIENNGTRLAVVKGQVAQARIALAEKGLPGKGQPGFELFDKQKRGASHFPASVPPEARRRRLPAEAHLPARAGGPDRLDHRPDPGRLRRPGLARAARGPALLPGPDAGHAGPPSPRLSPQT